MRVNMILQKLRLLFWTSLGFAGTIAAEPQRWVVYYNNQATYEDLRAYNPLVFDSETHPPLKPFLANDKTTLAYISLGEAATHNSYFADVKAQGLLLGENSSWPGSYFIDLRNPLWTKRVIEEIIPSILFQRFSGLFLDTLDDADYLEQEDPVKYKGMREAAIKLVRTIRKNYPMIPIMMNRGLDIAPAVVHDINMILAEATWSFYDVKKKAYEHVPQKEYQAYADRLRLLEHDNPTLTVYTLDYWDPTDAKGISAIYHLQRENGFIPYVSTRDLQKIIQEPK